MKLPLAGPQTNDDGGALSIIPFLILFAGIMNVHIDSTRVQGERDRNRLKLFLIESSKSKFMTLQIIFIFVLLIFFKSNSRKRGVEHPFYTGEWEDFCVTCPAMHSTAGYVEVIRKCQL